MGDEPLIMALLNGDSRGIAMEVIKLLLESNRLREELLCVKNELAIVLAEKEREWVSK